MRTVLETKQTNRARVRDILIGANPRTQAAIDAINRIVAAWGLTSIDAATFGLFNSPAGCDVCSIGLGSKVLTSQDDRWSAGDVGKAIHVAGAGAAGGTLASVIETYTNSKSVTLRHAAATAVAAGTGTAAGLAVWGLPPSLTLKSSTLLDVAGSALHSLTPAVPGGASRAIGTALANVVNLADFAGVDTTGATDSTAAVNAALATCAAGDVVECRGTVLVSSDDITVPAGVTLRFVTMNVAGAYRVLLNSDATLFRCTILNATSTGFQPTVKLLSGSTRATVERCRIKGGTGIYVNSATKARIERNDIESGTGYGIFSDGTCDEMRIAHNGIDVIAAGRGILVGSSSLASRVQHNTVRGGGVGVAGIVNLSALLADSFITDNIVDGFTEEGVSIDNNYNAEIRTITTINRDVGGSDIVVHAGTNFAVNAYLDKTIMFISGAAAGVSLRVTYNGLTDVYVRAGSIPGVQVGDKYAIGRIPRNVVIGRNRVTNCGREGVMVYGAVGAASVIDNVVVQCGMDIQATFSGHTPYGFHGISVLGNTSVFESVNMGARVRGNRVSACRLGIHVGAAWWDFTATMPPQGVVLEGNDVEDCGTDYTIDSGVAGRIAKGSLYGSATYDPPSLADGAGATTTVTVTGAVLGDRVRGVSFSADLQGITCTGYVSAANTVAVRFQNESGGVLDLASGTLRVAVERT